MRRFSKQILMLLLTLWLLATGVFVCLYALPGDPARLILGPQASADSVTQFRRVAGLEEPIGQQYLQYLMKLVRLDLGSSWLYRRPVATLLLERGGTTLKLVAASGALVLVASFLLPISLRLANAKHWLKAPDAVLTILATVPPYLLGICALQVFAGWLGWFPVLFEPRHWISWIIPALVLAAYPAALMFRLFDDGLERELSSAYCRRARAFGLPRVHVVLREAMPNAMAAALAGAANSIAFFVTGTFFVEVVFGIGGWGRLAHDAIRNRDLALLGPLCLIFAAIVAFVMQAAGWTQRALDQKTNHAQNL